MPTIEGQIAASELIELSWIVVFNGVQAGSSASIDGLVDKGQIWIVPEYSHVHLGEHEGVANGVTASEAFQQVRLLFVWFLILQHRG